MTKRYDDLTIDEVMTDPMIRTVMRADRVEPRQFETLLRRLAAVPAVSGRHYGMAPLAMVRGAVDFRCGTPCA